MEQLELTAAQIKGDIATYRQRIERIRQQIDDLEQQIIPSRKKAIQRQTFKNEVKHIRQMMAYAQDALDLMEGET